MVFKNNFIYLRINKLKYVKYENYYRNLENLSKIGIYKIQNLVNDKYYIGSTVDSFNKRLNHHYHALIRGNHKNDHLQNT